MLRLYLGTTQGVSLPRPDKPLFSCKNSQGVAHACLHVDQRSLCPSVICPLSLSQLLSLDAMLSRVFFGVRRIGEITAGQHNLPLSQCRIKPSKLRLVFQSHKHSTGRPFNLNLLPTSKTDCPYRRMVDCIKLSRHDQGPLFATPISCQDRKLPLQNISKQSSLTQI